jgi:hypothetical protein
MYIRSFFGPCEKYFHLHCPFVNNFWRSNLFRVATYFLHFLHVTISSRIRVTRLGDFSTIGRFFAHLAIVYFGRFFENDRSSPILCAIFPTVIVRYICVGLGRRNRCWATYILGNFFTNSPGHPAPNKTSYRSAKLNKKNLQFKSVHLKFTRFAQP